MQFAELTCFWEDNLKDSFSEPESFMHADLPLADLAMRYLQAMLTREQKQGRALVMGAVERGQSIKDLYLNVFEPVMYEIGRLWQTGKISVGQEHYCTNATQVTMSMLYPRLFKGVSSGKRMLAACAQNELHELGLRMVTDFFEMDGWDTDYLGANTPHESIIREIEEKAVDILAIGVTMYFHLEKAQKMIEAVRRATGAGNVKILLGGYIIKIDKTLWQTLGADGSAETARDAIALARKLTAKGTNHEEQ
jgi:methanogenic corrinoid protein MtbC1